MEVEILKSLKYEVGYPTVKTFLRHECCTDFLFLYVCANILLAVQLLIINFVSAEDFVELLWRILR